MDNKCYHRGSGEVVRLNWDKPVRNKFSQSEVEMQMWEEELQQHISEWNDHVLSRPVIGSIDPSYPVGWVGDDVEMVWQVRIRKSMEWFNTEKEIYDKWLTDGAKEDLRRILFLPVNKVTVKSESHAGEKKPFIVANVRDILDYWNNGEGCTFSRMVEMFNEVAARQQSAAEIDRLRGEVERLTGLLHETWNKQYPHPQYVQDLWQQFKTENNIQ